MSSFLKNMGFWGRSLALIILTLFMLILSILFGGVFSVVFFGQDSVVHQDVPVLLFLHIFTSVIAFVGTPLLFASICIPQKIPQALCFSSRPKALSMLICMLAMMVSAPLVSYLEEINLSMTLPESMQGIEQWMREREDAARVITEKFTNTSSLGGLAINILALAIVPAVGEELYFRAVVQRNILEHTTPIGKYISAIIAAIIFSAIHLQFFGFLPRMVLGVLLGIMLVITNNIWCSVFAHFVNNAMAVLGAFVMARGAGMEVSQYSCSLWAAIGSMILCAGLLYLLYKIEKK